MYTDWSGFGNRPSAEFALFGMMSESSICRKYVALYDFGIFWKYIAWFKDPFCLLEGMLPGMIRGTYMFRKYTAWYDCRILYP